MPDNLSSSIEIRIDTKKLRADAAIVKEELRKINAEVKAAAQAGDVSRVQAGAAQQDNLIRQLAAINQQVRANTAVKRENTAATEEATRSAREYGLELGHLAHLVGLPIEGIKALKFGFAAFASAELIRGIKEINSELSDLIELSRETRFDPSTIQAWTLAIERAGGKTEVAKASIKTFGEALLNQEKAMREVSRAGELTAQRTILGGGNTTQANAAAKKAMDEAYISSTALNGSLARLGVTAGRFPTTANGMRQALHQAATELVRLHQYSELEADLLSREIFGKPYADMAKALELAAKGTGDLLEKQAGLVALTKEQEQANLQYQAVVNELNHAWSEFATVLVTDVGPAIGIVLEALATLIKLVSQAVDGWKELAGLVGGGEGGGGGAVELSDKAQARIDSGAVAAHAAGGYIRGRGTGTSDSILARLSNGEFVVNAASVRRLGVGFMHGLNSFAAGGLVSSFAAGGSVSAASGGRAVHLHLGSQSFALSGAGHVVEALVSEAHWQQTRSAGVKPSWFGGRPGG
jgi:hypothetical protein